ncbi:hypothetical protein AV530_001104 [Patagioenas fasciata monilis]|uniref:Uncharacterized protein n=1 Tax=Patagioenas fasciata monilis TaxID=372326 RepID=A0A1V4KTH6_PATFA|nr:hypothetical protein AV530_001104 [Patagioenas fasciata monilis]
MFPNALSSLLTPLRCLSRSLPAVPPAPSSPVAVSPDDPFPVGSPQSDRPTAPSPFSSENTAGHRDLSNSN